MKSENENRVDANVKSQDKRICEQWNLPTVTEIIVSSGNKKSLNAWMFESMGSFYNWASMVQEKRRQETDGSYAHKHEILTMKSKRSYVPGTIVYSLVMI